MRTEHEPRGLVKENKFKSFGKWLLKPVPASIILASAATGLALNRDNIDRMIHPVGAIPPASGEPRSADITPSPTITPVPRITGETPTPTISGDTPRPSPSASQRTETQQTAEIPLVKFANEQEVANRFGADEYSKRASSWELAENGTAAVLKPDLSDNGGYPLANPNLHWGIEHLLNTNGGVVQGYDKIKRTPDGLETFQGNKVLNAQAQAEVTHPSVTRGYYAKATIRVPQNSADLDALYRKLKDDQIKLEAEFQPGTLTLPENKCPPVEARDVSVRTFKDTQEVANLFGGDDYTKKASSWRLVENNTAAVFIPDSSDPVKWGIEHRVKTSGAVVQGYNKIKRDAIGIENIQGQLVQNAQAEAKVIHPNVPEADLMAGTFRIAANSSDTDALFKKLLDDQEKLEVFQQPFTPTIPVMECPTPGGKGGGPTPTPTPSSAAK